MAEDMKTAFSQEAEVVDIDTTLENPAPRTVYKIDHDKALQSGVSAYDISEALQVALSHYEVGQYHYPNQKEFSPIELQVPNSDKDQIQDLSQIYVKNMIGEMVAIDSFVHKKANRNVPIRYLDERENTVYVTAEMGNRSVVYAVLDLIPYILDYKFPNDAQLESWNLFGFTFKNRFGWP